MTEQDRTLTWDGCHNVRDLGDLPTVDGGLTRRGAFIRADVLGRLTPQGKQALLDYGVRTIIDLRAPDEVAELPSAVFDDDVQAPLYINVKQELSPPEVLALFKQAQTRSELYTIALDHHAPNQVRVMRAIANAEPGGLIFHCHSGKDRTGIIAALLLDLAGVEPDAIAADYAETQKQLWPIYEKWLEETGGEEAIDHWWIPITEPQTMLDTLAHLETEYGGAEAYLLQGGQTPEEIAQLKARLL